MAAALKLSVKLSALQESKALSLPKDQQQQRAKSSFGTFSPMVGHNEPRNSALKYVAAHVFSTCLGGLWAVAGYNLGNMSTARNVSNNTSEMSSIFFHQIHLATPSETRLLLTSAAMRCMRLAFALKTCSF